MSAQRMTLRLGKSHFGLASFARLAAGLTLLALPLGGCGSAYGYAYALFGEVIAWMVGWNMVLGLTVAVGAVANGWAGYFNNALAAYGVALPFELTRGPFAGGILNLPAMAIILLLMTALFTGVKQSAKVNTAIVCASASV